MSTDSNAPDTQRSPIDPDPVLSAFERQEAKMDQALKILESLADRQLEQDERIRRIERRCAANHGNGSCGECHHLDP